ncbi:hypothetical protein Nmel_006559, partial [Mimus melanotis]
MAFNFGATAGAGAANPTARAPLPILASENSVPLTGPRVPTPAPMRIAVPSRTRACPSASGNRGPLRAPRVPCGQWERRW